MKKKFLFSFGGGISLTPEELWPDGDGPENPTEEDVLQLIEDCGGLHRILDDWNLIHNLTFNVLPVVVRCCTAGDEDKRDGSC